MKKLRFLLICLAAAVLFFACKPDTNPFDNLTIAPYPSNPEVPKKEANSNYIYVTHTAALNYQQVRNYTMCFDKTKYAAQWVAYPLHECYMGSSGRTDAWAYDPSISQNYQVPTKGYSAWNYTRGHQIPSADRTANNELNAQTFYMSNMTPQGYYFNSGIWVSLESRVRSSKFLCKDTLYVVTGAYWDNSKSNEWYQDNTVVWEKFVKEKYPVPTHYYKLFLRTRNGNTRKNVFNCKPDELMCIGFWLEHKIYRNETEAAAMETLGKKHCKSVAEIEQITGFTFFPDVDVDKTQCVPKDWGF